MALTGTARGTGTKNASGTTITLSPNANVAVGSMLVLVFATDNAHAAGTAFTTFTCTDDIGNTWTAQQVPLYDPGAASAGITGAIFTTTMNVGQILSTTVITVTVDTATTASAWGLWEVVPGAGNSVRYVTGGVNTGAGTGTPTVTTGSIANGDMVIGGVFAENTSSSADPWVGDADTTNGSWSTEQHTGVTASTSGVSVGTQYKVVTAAGAQTYNPTASAGTPDCILAWIELAEVVTTTVTPTTANLIVTGYAPQLQLVLTPSTLALAVTGYAPQLQLVLTPSTLGLVLAEYAPTITVGLTVTPTTAGLVLTTFAPQLQAVLTPATANLVVAGYAPQLQFAVTPATLNLVLATFPPTVTGPSQSITVTPATLGLVLVTWQPTVLVTERLVTDDPFWRPNVHFYGFAHLHVGRGR